MSAPLAYLILGARDSGRLALIKDFARSGVLEAESIACFASSSDIDAAAEEGDWVTPYEWDGKQLSINESGDAKALFILMDGISNPADFVEAFHALLKEKSWELGRVITVVHCKLASQGAGIAKWFDCCIHFSDAVLMARREGVSDKWVESFKEAFRKKHFPCLFEFVKKGRVANPALILDPVARRISMLFDDAEEYDVSFEDEDDDEEEDIEDDASLLAGDPTKDPYLKRLVSGRREIVLPEIEQALAALATSDKD